jgi:hypothetical protein
MVAIDVVFFMRICEQATDCSFDQTDFTTTNDSNDLVF